ncbi:MAG: cation:proton antiporter [Clostridia bacterium]|nr:cation:proton antiporter [Clostridia bacterium]
MLETWLGLNEEALVLASVAIIWLAGFLFTRITKLCHLPNAMGYILAGVAIGPYALNVIPSSLVTDMGFIVDIALSFIAFGMGRYLRFDEIKKSGYGLIVIIALETLVSAAAVALTMYYVFDLSLSLSLMLGAVGSATSPTTNMMLIRKYRARGNFVDTLVHVVALDDMVAIIGFSVCAALAEAAHTLDSFVRAAVITRTIMLNIGAMALGCGLGYLLTAVINERRSKDHSFVLTCVFLFGLAAFCSAMNISPLIPTMIMGAVYANARRKDKVLFKQVTRLSPPITMMFLTLSGMKLNISMLPAVGIMAIAYFFVRTIGKMTGAYVGCAVTGASTEVRTYLGMALVPLASVSIGLAALSGRILSPASSEILSTIILSSCILSEMIGPMSSTIALKLAGAIDNPSTSDAPEGVTTLMEKWHERERLGKYDDIVYIAKDDADSVGDNAGDNDPTPPDAVETDLTSEYMDSLDEQERGDNDIHESDND